MIWLRCREGCTSQKDKRKQSSLGCLGSAGLSWAHCQDMSLAMALPLPLPLPLPQQLFLRCANWQIARQMANNTLHATHQPPTPRCLSIFICPMQTVCDFYPLPPLHRSPLSADHKLHFIIRLIVHPCVEPMSSDCTTAGHSGRLAVRHEKERGRRREGERFQ